jgi:flagellar biosynthesis/type III secretory pathway M-ring protein FliF/YscJ
VVVVIAVVVAIVLVVALVVALAVYVRRAPDPTVPLDALASLHAIRARTMAARYRRESRRDADRIRRELRHEIHELDKGQ